MGGEAGEVLGKGLGVHSVVCSLRDPRLYQDNENSALCPALRSQVTLTEKQKSRTGV